MRLFKVTLVLAASVVLLSAAPVTALGAPVWEHVPTGLAAGDFTDVGFSDANHGWVTVGSGTSTGSVLHTGDGGGSWTLQTHGHPALRGIASLPGIDADTAWAVGDGGTVIRTTDGGDHWVPQVSGTTASLQDVRFADADRGWIAGDRGVILRTTDGGAHWARASTGTTETLRGLTFVSATAGWAAGDGGVILRTGDGGAHWTRQVSGVTEDLRGISFKDALHGWAVGGRYILRTTDGGLHWSAMKHGHDDHDVPDNDPWNTHYFDYPSLESVHFRDAENGWAVGARFVGFEGEQVGTDITWYRVIWRTADGGRHWKQEFGEKTVRVWWTDVPEYSGRTGALLPFHSVRVAPGGTVWAVGSGDEIERCLDPLAIDDPAALKATSIPTFSGAPYSAGKTTTATFRVKNTSQTWSGTWDAVTIQLKSAAGTIRMSSRPLDLDPGREVTLTVTGVPAWSGTYCASVVALRAGAWSTIGTGGSFTAGRGAANASLLAPATCPYAGPVKLSGTLRGVAGKGIAGSTVTIQTSADGTSWTTIANVTSGPSGAFSALAYPTRRAFYRVHWAGDRDYAACTSAAVTVLPQVYLTTPTVRASAVHTDRPVSVAGYLGPRHTAGTSPVKLLCYHYERQADGTTKWVLRLTQAAEAHDYENYSMYRAEVSLTRRGSWRLQAWHPQDTQNASTYSGWQNVIVTAP
jgi:photosystem II stability/assembly factor-like uncharacterized protein